MIRNTFKFILAASFVFTCLSVNAQADEWSVAVANDDIPALTTLLEASHPVPSNEEGTQLWRYVAFESRAAVFAWFVANGFPGMPDKHGVDAWGLAAGVGRTDLLELLKNRRHPTSGNGLKIWQAAAANKRPDSIRWLHANNIPGMDEIGEGGQNLAIFTATYDADTVMEALAQLRFEDWSATDNKSFNIWEVSAANGSTKVLAWLCSKFPKLFEGQRNTLRDIARFNEQPGVVEWIDHQPVKYISADQENALMQTIQKVASVFTNPGQLK